MIDPPRLAVLPSLLQEEPRRPLRGLRDRLLLLGLNQALLTFSSVPAEERTWLLLLHLAAFVLILAAIWRKNVRALR